MIKNILTHTVHETNWCAKSYLEKHNKKAENSYLSKWKDTDILEMKNIFGLIILMVITINPIFTCACHQQMNYITLQYFQRWSHMNDFYCRSKYQWQFRLKLRTKWWRKREPSQILSIYRIEMIRERFCKVYYSWKHLNVAESLVLFKVGLHFKQHIKTKSTRFGIKLYEVKSSNGIALDFLAYCRKGMLYNYHENKEMPT